MRSSTSTMPRSPVLTPAASSPSPSTSGRAPGGDAEVVEALRAVAPVELDRLGRRLHVLDPRAGHDLHVLLAQLRGDHLRDLGVLERQDLVEHLDQRRPRCRSGRTRRRSRPRRRPRRPPRAAPAARSASTSARCRAPGPRSSCPGSAATPSPSRGRPCRPRARCPSTATRPLPGQRRGAVDDVDLVLLHQAGDAPVERLHDLVAVRGGALDVELESFRRRSRTRRRPAPRPARPPPAASPWPGCRPRSGSARRAPRRARRRPSSCPTCAARIAAT